MTRRRRNGKWLKLGERVITNLKSILAAYKRAIVLLQVRPYSLPYTPTDSQFHAYGPCQRWRLLRRE